jgi:hypothetical protein
MNDPRPLTPDTVDALLSAELDGELDAAAADLGLSAEQARAQLDSVPGVAERRRALGDGRDRIAARPDLALADRDRLVARALAAATVSELRPRRDRSQTARRVLVAAGSVAAAVAVVLGIANLLHGTSASRSSAPEAASALPTTAKASETPGPAHPQSAGDFGDVTSLSTLRAEATDRLSKLQGDTAASGHQTSGDTTVPSAYLAPDNNGSTAGGATNATFGPAVTTCSGLVRTRYAIAAQPLVVGTGTVSGAPVAVVVFGGPHPVAYVVSAAGCALVRRQPLG